MKAWELVRQVIFFESKAFHVRYAVSHDFVKVPDFSNVSVTTLNAWPETKLFADNLQVVMLTDHNDDIHWYKYVFFLELF